MFKILLTLIIALLTSTSFALPDFEAMANKEVKERAHNVVLESTENIHQRLMGSPGFILGTSISYDRGYYTYEATILGSHEVVASGNAEFGIDWVIDIISEYNNKVRVGIFDQYNMLQGPAKFNFSNNGLYVDIADGLQKSHGNMQELFIGSKFEETYVKAHNVNGVGYVLKVRVFLSYTGNIYTRLSEKADLKGEIKFQNDRTLNGAEISYYWEGPRPSVRPSSQEYVPITDNKFNFTEELIGADYSVDVYNAFCGCNFGLAEDRPYDYLKSNKHTFRTALTDSNVIGRLVNEEDDSPISNVMVDIKGACEDADSCMNEVESVMTDEDGNFEFKEVPSGVYSIMYRGKNLGKATNCNVFNSNVVDAGIFKVTTPKLYNIHMDYSRHAGDYEWNIQMGVTWKDILIGAVTDKSFIAQLINFDPMGELNDSNGNPLLPPFTVSNPYSPVPPMVMFGLSLDMDSPPELRYLTNALTGDTTGKCIYLSDPNNGESENAMELIYTDKPTAGMFGPATPGHHFNFTVELYCGKQGSHMQQHQIILTHMRPLVNAQMFYQEVADADFSKAMLEGKEYTKKFTNPSGANMTVKFEPVEKPQTNDSSCMPDCAGF